MSKKEEIMEVFKQEVERYIGTMRREDPEEEWRWDYIPPIKSPQKLAVMSSRRNVKKRPFFKVKKP